VARIAVVYPESLGTYGDAGNALVLAKRLQWRGIRSQLVPVRIGAPVPEYCDVYVLGGGEDVAQTAAAMTLRRSRGFRRGVESGAGVFAVCAGLQILGEHFCGPGGHVASGLGLLDARSDELATRAVGDVVVDTAPTLVGPVTGFENHRSGTRLGPGLVPLGRVRHGVGNGDGGDGVMAGGIIGTYLHGPVLAANPALADLILERVVGPLPDLDVEAVHALRQRRLGAISARRSHNPVAILRRRPPQRGFASAAS